MFKMDLENFQTINIKDLDGQVYAIQVDKGAALKANRGE